MSEKFERIETESGKVTYRNVETGELCGPTATLLDNEKSVFFGKHTTFMKNAQK